MESYNYHKIEKILTDFKNGETYSCSIEKVEKIIALSRHETLREIMTVVEKEMSKKLPLFHEECATGIKEMCDKCEAKKHFISGRVASCSDLLLSLQSLLSNK